MFSVIINGELVAKTETLKDAWEIAKAIKPKSTYDFEDIKEQHTTQRKIFLKQVENGAKQPNEWDFKAWLNDEYVGDRIVEDTELSLKRHDDYIKEHQNINFGALWIIIHIILAVCSGGITLILWSLPWVIAKYQTKNNFSVLGVFCFGFLYNLYRLIK